MVLQVQAERDKIHTHDDVTTCQWSAANYKPYFTADLYHAATDSKTAPLGQFLRQTGGTELQFLPESPRYNPKLRDVLFK